MFLCLKFISLFRMLNAMVLFDKNQSFSSDTEGDIEDFILGKGKGYLPNENDLHRTAMIKSVDNDVSYLLSKLTDNELIKLLNEQPSKKDYNIHELINIATDSKSDQDHKPDYVPVLDFKPSKHISNEFVEKQHNHKKNTDKNNGAVFRLENKEIDPFSVNKDIDPEYIAIQKLHNILYSRPSEIEQVKNENDDDKKELLFNILVAQLKSLCCKKSKLLKNKDLIGFNSGKQMFHDKKYEPGQSSTKPNEHMFLILNDEIKSNGSDGLISVDPDSLGKNSSVLLLGPIATPLDDAQLRVAMTRIENELSKKEYIPLLQQLSEGTIDDENVRLVKSLVTGPETRRYIKPHRCNHQSKLATVYGGPKWLICTDNVNESNDHERNITRCNWVTKDPLYIKYHDDEWGKPEFENHRLFQMLCLEGQQAGLSWITILKKRESYRKLFFNVNPHKISKFNNTDLQKLTSLTSIVRHRGKIEAIINNAKCYLKMENEGEDFSKFIWSFVDHIPVVNSWNSVIDIPTETPTSIALAKALKKRGFKYVGSTICYAFMQACGLVNDHIVSCISYGT